MVRALRQIAVLLELRGESAYRIRAYETAASRIAQVEGDLHAMAREGRLESLPGIGPKLAARVVELLETGSSQYLEDLQGAFPPGITELVRVPGLGAKRAVQLWEALGVGDVAALKDAVERRAVREVPGFGVKAEAKLEEALQAFRVHGAPEPGSRQWLLGPTLVALEELAGQLTARGALRAEVAGDVRRACEEVREPVLVAAAEDPWALLEDVGTLPSVAKVSASAKAESDAAPHAAAESSDEAPRLRARLFHDDLIVEVRAVPKASFGAAWLDATGSLAHVAHLRARAEAKGLMLTGEGLSRGALRIGGEEEEALYRALDLPFIPPELRDRDASELEGEGPFEELLREEDVQGLVHSHSTWSDGKATLEEMATAAKARGFKWMTVTEHSQTASYAGGLKPDELKQQWEEIDALNEKLRPFRLLKGIESDILKDGALDYPDGVLRELDVVVGSIHNRYGLDERQTTDRLLKALSHPLLSILGHTTGRLLQRRPPVALKMDEVLAAAAEHGVTVELNGSPHRLDLSAAHARLAVAKGVKLVVSADAHSTREIGNVRYAVLTARRAGVRRSQVLNTQGAAAFLRGLARSRR